MTEHISHDPLKTKKKPAYLEVKEDLIRRVLNGEWRPGELVPSEVSLAEEYSVSVGTARKAVEQLVQDKLVVRQRGRGTMISSNRGEGTSRPFSFLKFYDEQGRHTREARYLTIGTRTADTIDMERLGISEQAEVATVKRLRMADPSRPDVIEHIVLREDLCPHAARLFGENHPISISSFLDRMYNILIIRIDERISATEADADDVEHLGLRAGEPVLEMIRIAYDLGGNAIEHRRTHVRQGVYYHNINR